MGRLTKILRNGKALCIAECEKECVEGYYECHKCKPFADVLIKLAEYEDAEDKDSWITYANGEDLPWNGQKVWLSFTSPYTSFVKSAYWIYDHFEWANGKTVKDVPLAWKPYVVPEPYKTECER